MDLSFIIATNGRPTLRRTLQSLIPQLKFGDEVIVVGDGYQPLAKDICGESEFHLHTSYYTGPEKHFWGCPQREFGMYLAQGDYILFIDDDDVYVPDSIPLVRLAIKLWPTHPMLFQHIDKNGLVLWAFTQVQQGNVGTPQIVVPNVPARFGKWGDRYEGDFDFIRTTLKKSKDVVWCPNVLVDCRVLDV